MESGSLCFISCQVWAVVNSLGRMVPGGCVVRKRIQAVDCWRTDMSHEESCHGVAHHLQICPGRRPIALSLGAGRLRSGGATSLAQGT